jgi:hypothetical protein
VNQKKEKRKKKLTSERRRRGACVCTRGTVAGAVSYYVRERGLSGLQTLQQVSVSARALGTCEDVGAGELGACVRVRAISWPLLPVTCRSEQ